MTSNDFQHYQTAHCESGVTSGLLQNSGVALSEAMTFGIGSGIFFVYLPFVKVMRLPLTSYRSFPGGIFKKTCHRLKIPYEYKTYRAPLNGSLDLENHLSQNQAVGIRTNIYWLPYIPERYRFQFNGHNLIVFGKNSEGNYLVSDPVLESTSLCSPKALAKARFARGILAPQGLLFFPKVQKKTTLETLPLSTAIKVGIRETVHRNLYAPLPFFGVKGINFLSSQMKKWPRTLRGLETQKLYLANVVRMQEEIGTGGAGFRYLYSAFLQEAGILLDKPALIEASSQMTQVGNLWREFATLAAKFCKDRLEDSFEVLPRLLTEIAADEKAIYHHIRRKYL